MQAVLIILISLLLLVKLKVKEQTNIVINVGVITPEKKIKVLQQIERAIREFSSNLETYCIKINEFYQVRNDKEELEVSVKGTSAEVKKEGTKNLQTLLSSIH